MTTFSANASAGSLPKSSAGLSVFSMTGSSGSGGAPASAGGDSFSQLLAQRRSSVQPSTSQTDAKALAARREAEQKFDPQVRRDTERRAERAADRAAEPRTEPQPEHEHRAESEHRSVAQGQGDGDRADKTPRSNSSREAAGKAAAKHGAKGSAHGAGKTAAAASEGADAVVGEAAHAAEGADARRGGGATTADAQGTAVVDPAAPVAAPAKADDACTPTGLPGGADAAPGAALPGAAEAALRTSEVQSDNRPRADLPLTDQSRVATGFGSAGATTLGAARSRGDAVTDGQAGASSSATARGTDALQDLGAHVLRQGDNAEGLATDVKSQGSGTTAAGVSPGTFAALLGSARAGEQGAAQAASQGASAPAATGNAAAGWTGGSENHTIPASLYSPDFAPALGSRLSLLAHSGVQHAELQITPADMGPISVQIALDGAQVTIDFAADMAATREKLESSLPELAGALREAGLTLAGGGVHEQHRGRGDAAPDETQRGFGNAAADRPGVEAGTVASTVPAQRHTGRGVVDLYA